MSLKDQGENKAIEPAIPENYTREYARFCRAMESETDPDALGALQVRWRQVLMQMSTLKIFIPQDWSDAHNACGEKMSRQLVDAFRRRNA